MSILGKLGSTAGAIFKTVYTPVIALADSMDMLDKYVQKAKRDQHVAHTIHAKFYIQQARLESQERTARHRRQLQKDFKEDPELKGFFDELTEEYNKLEADLVRELKSL
jgi:hypothetical protein